jgi:hypothetical protein
VKAAVELSVPLAICPDAARPHTLYVTHDNGKTISALDKQTGACIAPLWRRLGSPV